MLKRQLLLIVASATFTFSSQIHALETNQPDTVTSRDRPELDPQGMRASSFLLYPALDVEAMHDDNIFADNDETESDLITRIKPELVVESDWSRNGLNFKAFADFGRYKDNGDEDFDDYLVSADGFLGIKKANHLAGEISHARKHVARSSPNDRNGIEPTIYYVNSISADYRHRFNRLSFQVGGNGRMLDYDNVEGSQGIINNQDQDRDELLALLQVNYDVSPALSAFARAQYKDIKYDQKYDNNGIRRSSNGNQVDLGIELFPSGKISGEVYLGYVNRDYDDPVFDGIDEPIAGASLTWIPSGLTTVTFSSSRDIEETTVDTASGILSTDHNINIDHELLRNLLLNFNLGIRDEEFEGTSRNDDYKYAGFGVRYLMNRNVYLYFSYDYDKRDSDTQGGANDYTINETAIGVRVQL